MLKAEPSAALPAAQEEPDDAEEDVGHHAEEGVPLACKEDCGFLVHQLMLHVITRVEQSKQKKGKKMAWRPKGSTDTAEAVSLKLLRCIRRVQQSTAKRQLQEKLQTLVMDWLKQPTEPELPSLPSLEKKIGDRKAFWSCYRTKPGLKWQEPLLPIVEPSDAKLTSPVHKAVSNAEMYAKSSLSSYRKPRNNVEEMHALLAKKPELLRQRFRNGEDDDMDDQASTEAAQLPRIGSKSAAKLRRQELEAKKRAEAEAKKFAEAEERRRDEAREIAAFGSRDSPGYVSPRRYDASRYKAPALLKELPDWQDMTGERRSKHRSTVAYAHDKKHDESCRCSICLKKSKQLLDRSQGIVPRPKGKPVNSVQNIDDYDAVVKKSQDRGGSLPKCVSLPLLNPKQRGTQSGALADLDPVDPPYGKVKVFPDPYEPDNSTHMVRSGMWRYLQECHRAQVVPRAPKLLLKESSEFRSTSLGHLQSTEAVPLDFACQELLDTDLQPISEMAQQLGTRVTSLDLSHNGLSDTAVATFLQKLPGQQLRLVDLSKCGVQSDAIAQLEYLLVEHWERVKTLKLTGIKFGNEQGWERLAKAVTQQGNIYELGLADTKLGAFSQRCVQSVADLIVQANYLQELDLSGNYLHYEGFEFLSAALSQCKMLKILDVSHNASSHVMSPTRSRLFRGKLEDSFATRVVDSLGVEVSDLAEVEGDCYEELPAFNPVSILCEALPDAKTLTELRMENSSVDYTADCVLLSALLVNKSLKILKLANNPHGDLGLRCLLRLLSLSPTIEHLDTSGCSAASVGPGVLTTDLGQPKGHFDFILTHPQHRAVLKWLLHRAESLGVKPPQAAFTVEEWSLPKENWCFKRDGGKGWGVATRGHLSVQFALPLELEKAASVGVAVKKWQGVRRIPVTFAKWLPIIGMYERCETSEERSTFVRAVGQTLSLKPSFLTNIMKMNISNRQLTDIAKSLYGNLDDQNSKMLFFDIMQNKELAKDFRRQARARIDFNVDNPTQCYSLDLSLPLDRSVADQLHVINSYERARAKAAQEVDVSEFGNHEGARNLYIDSSSFQSFAESGFESLTSGFMTLDYVSPANMAPTSVKTKASTEILVNDLMSSIETSNCAVPDKVLILRCISQHLVLTVEQVHRILKLFPNPSVRTTAEERWKFVRRLMKARVLDCKGSHSSAFQTEIRNPRLEVFICLFNRCKDWPLLCSMECLNNWLMFSLEDAEEIRRRLGTARSFDALDCCRPWRLSGPSEASRSPSPKTPEMKKWGECDRKALLVELRKALQEGMDEKDAYEMEPGRRYRLNLEKHEDRAVLQLLCNLTNKEEGEGIVRGAWLEREETGGSSNFSLPPEWASGPPQEGMVALTYMSEAEQNISLTGRRALAERFCGWPKTAAG
eukprot:TRINITY_DN110874_c0_g1_i1.p1 TRINITY_DN110874_c0_g1~~TRINITY_DN110874_c0_g1_i1.p1  ORF type:complete len:1395 (+),score=337.86 TRINITY_DN110874_c0_g1_i1:258-4442(+)